MNKNGQTISIDGVNLDSPSSQYISGRKVLPLEGRIKKRISKLNLSNDYDWRVQNDEAWLQAEAEIIKPRRRKIKKNIISYENMLMFEEVANNILYEPLLTQSYGNPSWYPPVPEYTPPKGRRLSTQEVVEIGFKIAQSRANTETRKVVDSENFGDAWVYVTETMPTVEEFNELNQDTDNASVKDDKIDILPLVDSNRFYTEVALMSTIEGTIENKNYQYPNIVERIKWRVDYYCADEGNTLLGVHVYSDSDAISEVTEFLADNPVSNEEEQNEAIVSLSQAYWELSKK